MLPKNEHQLANLNTYALFMLQRQQMYIYENILIL